MVGQFLIFYPISFRSSAGTMFELVKALNNGAKTLKTHSSNPISLNAGCELFITFVTRFPHDSDVCFDSLFQTDYSTTPFSEFHRSKERAYSTRTKLCRRSTHLSSKNRRIGRGIHQGRFGGKLQSAYDLNTILSRSIRF